jgi:cytochrome c553
VAFAALVIGVALAGSAQARDYEAGKKKAEEVCKACHGADGNTPLTPETPKLAGQYYDYLVHSLQAYRKGCARQSADDPYGETADRCRDQRCRVVFLEAEGSWWKSTERGFWR